MGVGAGVAPAPCSCGQVTESQITVFSHGYAEKKCKGAYSTMKYRNKKVLLLAAVVFIVDRRSGERMGYRFFL